MKNEEMKFVVTNDDGVETEYEIVITFESEETGKCYMIYTDHSIDNEGYTRAFGAIYNPDEDGMRLFPITTEKEWQIIDTMLEVYHNEINRRKMNDVNK